MRRLWLYMGRATKSIGAGILADGNFKAPATQCIFAVSIPFACAVPALRCVARDSFVSWAGNFPELVYSIFSSGICTI